MHALEILETSTGFFLSLIALLSLSVGSFLNVLIVRLPKRILNQAPSSLFRPGSACPHCQQAIRYYHNIPIFSFIWLKGRCSACRKKIAWHYPGIEALTCLISVWVALHFGYSKALIPALFLSWALIALSFIDLKHYLLPDDITLPCLWLGLLLSCFSVFQNANSAILGAILGYLILWSIYWSFKAFTGKEGMGYGDFKLMSMLGAWLGWQMLPAIIFIASLLGSILGLYLIIFKKRDKSLPLPFGPMIAVAGFIALLYGQEITRFYLGYMGYL